MNPSFTFHHLGLAVRQPRRAQKFLAHLGYEPGEAVRDPLQNVNLMMCTHSQMPRVEVVWPTESDGPLSRFLKSADELVYHLCYEVPSIADALSNLGADGMLIKEVSSPRPALLFEGRCVGFYVVAGVGLVELLEREWRAP